MIRDNESVAFTYKGGALCRFCTFDVLRDIVLENAYATPDALNGLGIWDLFRIIDTSGFYLLTTDDGYRGDHGSPDFPVPLTVTEPGERCSNPECDSILLSVYRSMCP